MSIIESAIRTAESYTSHNSPRVMAFLSGRGGVAAKQVRLAPKLMTEIEEFLASVGVPVKEGLSVLKADAAADALVLEAKGLKGTGREVVIKLMPNDEGFFVKHPFLEGNSLLLDEPMMNTGINKTFASALPRQEVLLRIEPKMRPVDVDLKAIAEASNRPLLSVLDEFRIAQSKTVMDKGLAALDVKANNFGVPIGSPMMKSVEEALAHPQLRSIDVGAMRVRDPQFVKDSVNPVHYTPKYLSAEQAPKHIDELFSQPELPELSGVTGKPATQEAQIGLSGAGNKKGNSH